MNKHYKALELDKILSLLSKETTCEEAAQKALEIEPAYSLFEVNELLNQTYDAHCLIGRFGMPSFGGIKNVSNSLRRAQSGGCLSIAEILQIGQTLHVIRTVRDWKNRSASTQTCLDMYFNSLCPNKHLEDRINNSIISEDELSDNASGALSDIRRKIRTASSKAREVLEKIIHSSIYQKYLQEAIVTQRSGRYVVPVKAEFRSKISGLVHDTSASGATVFIEPMGVVQANNDIKVLLSKEEAEIERILFEISALLGGFADEIIASYNNLIELNVIFAKAQLAYKMKASLPVMNDEGIIDLNKSRHPLIDKNKVVPINVNLGKDFDCLVVTGPNTGGKTVCLKTVGLLTLMAMCGLMIPAADNSKLSVFKRILADIGDEQSIEQSLSTFSAHITNIIQILKLSNKKSLVLIDELGAGTDPVEGAALATAILEKLRYLGAKIACTTHYAELKEYALKTDGVENGCCEFDVVTLRPTYRLLIGVPGKSNAFAISKRLGMEEDIVIRAQELTSIESRQFEDVAQKLEAGRQELEQKLNYANELIAEANKKKALAEKELEKANKKADEQIEQARRKAQQLTDKTKAQAYALLDKLDKAEKENRLSAEEKTKLKQNIKKMENTADPINKQANLDYKLPRKLKAGDNVLIFDIDKKAEVIEVDESTNTALVQAGIIKTRVKQSNLRLLEDKKVTTPVGAKTRNVHKNFEYKAVTEIDVRGQTAVEAIIAVDNAIDSAILTNVNQITVIHGKGTGVLRREIHLHLRNHKAVKTFRLGTFGEGESGVTIIELK